MVDLSPEEFCELMQIRREDLKWAAKLRSHKIEQWEREGIVADPLIVGIALKMKLESL